MNFSKMHGLGNDFMVINCIKENFILSSTLIKKFSHRHTGIGFDQLLIIEKSYNPLFDFHYRIFNSNGNEVEQCGNGARCVGYFLLLKNLTNKKKISVSTKTGNLIIEFLSNNLVQVNMQEPVFKLTHFNISKNILQKNFSINLLNLTCSLVSIGNPHCILKVQNIQHAPVNIIGKQIESNPLFLSKINVGFMEIVNKKYIKYRVYERDVGETYACGSGACAAVAVGIIKNDLSNTVKVRLLGGNLIIKWQGVGYPLYMIGPASHIYDGFIYI
ncbi:diaminopimelate epimerase [Buchnera aphidicola]|uniref:diaminopimelate epimerase n=1 Tax=Buchnera aphidicola TaxID=9 RepID=UPI0020B14183|nr:diaminopimelate epimerase [Buchnera aphidicola]